MDGVNAISKAKAYYAHDFYLIRIIREFILVFRNDYN